MRFVVLVIAGWGAIAAAHAQGLAILRNCVGGRELQELVSRNAVVPPANALLAARRHLPAAELLRGNLCWWDNGLVYVVLALGKDGRLLKVTIDAASGKVQSVQ